jgi:hypothetical protein
MVSAWWRLGAGQVTPGQHVASLVAVDGLLEPSGARAGADQHEQGRRGDGLGAGAAVVAKGESFQQPGALPAARLGVQPDRDVGVAPAPTRPEPPRTRRGNRSLAAGAKTDPASAPLLPVATRPARAGTPGA